MIVLAASAALATYTWLNVQAYRAEIASARPYRTKVVRPADAGELRLQDAVFRAPGGPTIHGWYLPSRSGAAVLLAHGSENDRTSMLPEARALRGCGFGVLLFDWPAHGESEGNSITLGPTDRAALVAALDWVLAQPGVRPDGVGVYGFSNGAYRVAQVAATEPRFHAVVLAASPEDILTENRRYYGRLRWLGGRLGTAVTTDLAAAPPSAVVDRIAPRPLLVISGSEDRTVPPEEERALYERAREPKQFMLVEGAGHGNYFSVDSGFGARLCRFFREGLGNTSADDQPLPNRVRSFESTPRVSDGSSDAPSSRPSAAMTSAADSARN